jgi:hypothetical protein
VQNIPDPAVQQPIVLSNVLRLQGPYELIYEGLGVIVEVFWVFIESISSIMDMVILNSTNLKLDL